MKKILPVAVLSALAGVNAAQATQVSSDGLGQVLLYPFYTAEGGQDTLINLVNTTGDYKAVKIRILESMNSQEVLDFNLYMSPQDHWSAVISADASGTGATIRSGDTTCTVPNAVSNGDTIAFRNYEYTTDFAPIPTGLERTKEGYVEVIEMGIYDLADTTPATAPPATTFAQQIAGATKHVNGTPPGCAFLSSAWGTAGYWGGTPGPATAITDPTGGLYGYGVLIDVAEGTDATYDAVAIANFYNGLGVTHTNPGSLLPSLNQANLAYNVFDGGNASTPVVSGTAVVGIDAVSATMMQVAIANDFVLEQAISAGTDWVVTFPTKREYVNVDDPNLPVVAPFTTKWGGRTPPPGIATPACEAISIVYYDREELGVAPQDLDFSPQPPGNAPFAMCYEANVLTFNESNVLKASPRTGSNLNVIHENGWATLNFSSAVFGGAIPAGSLGVFTGTTPAIAVGGNPRELILTQTFAGLPTVGFAVQKYVNGDLGGVLSNYAGSVTHKGVRSIF